MVGSDPGEVLVLPLGAAVPSDTPDDTLVVFYGGSGAPPPPPDVAVQYVPPPTPVQVAEFLGWPTALDVEHVTQLSATINAARATVFGYTRGVGFAVDGSSDGRLGNIIVALAARMAANPTSAVRLQAGAFTETPAPPGFLLHEMLILQQFRIMTA